MTDTTTGQWVSAGLAGVHGAFIVRATRTEAVGEVVDCWGGTKNHRAYRTFRADQVRPTRRPDWARDLHIGQDR